MSEFSNFLRERLRTENALPFNDDDSPPWWGKALPSRSTYFHYLDLLPPRFMNVDLFVFGEGAGNFILFCVKARRYFAHQLSIEDTETFCRLTRVSLHV